MPNENFINDCKKLTFPDIFTISECILNVTREPIYHRHEYLIFTCDNLVTIAINLYTFSITIGSNYVEITNGVRITKVFNIDIIRTLLEKIPHNNKTVKKALLHLNGDEI